MNDTRKEWVDGLHAVADYVEAHPGLPLPSAFGARFYLFAGHEADEGETPLAFLTRCARELRRTDKDVDPNYFSLSRRFGPHAIVALAARDAVCERVVVGTEPVEVQVPPEGVAMVTVTEQRDVVEWRCPESLLAAAAERELADSSLSQAV
jgi:hypothetical protein